MQHQHLASRAIARANADGVASAQGLRQFGGQSSWHHFQHQHAGAGLLQGQGIFVQLGGSGRLAALHPVAAQGVHGLRREAQMRTHRNAALHQEMHGVGRPIAAFKFHHVGPGLHQHHGAAQRLFGGLVVGAKGQVANHPSGALDAAQTAHHAFGVVAHGFQTDTRGAVQTLADHAQRVAHQNAFHASSIGHGGEGGVVGGDHGDLVASRSHVVQARQADRFARRHVGGGRQSAVGTGRVAHAGSPLHINWWVHTPGAHKWVRRLRLG